MDGEPAEFPDSDWELLPNSEGADFVGTHSQSGALIRSDYFSLHPSDHRTFDDSDAAKELRPPQMEAQHIEFADLDVIRESGSVDDPKTQVGMQDKSSEKSFFDSGGGDGLISDAEMPEASEFCTSELEGGLDSSKMIGEEERSVESASVAGGEGEKRAMVWWKVPFEVFKYCVVRVNPVWSFSVAAAFVGLIILGRRMYKMKRKSQGLKLKVAVDDKKVSQFMSRAARLNEAFSVVRRASTIRPSLPASGVTLWPVMSMR